MKTPIATLVGESNPYGSDPRFALYPDPPGCAGWRLCHRILGLSEVAYLGAFRRVNLLGVGASVHWSAPRAREAAAKLRELTEPDGRQLRLILLGAKVAAAFGVRYQPLLVDGGGTGATEFWGHRALVLPHPSGRCLWWNGEGNMAAARTAVEIFCDVRFVDGRVREAE